MAKKDWMVKESELDDDQIKVLNATNDKSCIVSGCAGSGKSILALIKAQRIQREKGDDYQIIVYTKALCRYMEAGREELNLKNEFSFHQEWKYRRMPKTYANGQTYMVYERGDNGKLIPKNPLPTSDYIIVDEIQDFSKEEILEFVNASRKNFFFFGDTAQSIYDGLKSTMKVEDINYMLTQEQRAKSFELFRNYRLPKTVAKVVQYIGIDLDGFDLDTYKSQETAVPRFIRYDSLDSQVNSIARLIKGGAISDVAILVTHNEDVKRLSDMLNYHNINHEAKYEVYRDMNGNTTHKKKTDNITNRWIKTSDNLDFSTENPKVMTYHSAKGLQFGTVFLPKVAILDSAISKSEQKALYVAMTRTYRNLYVMYNGSLPYPLSKVPSNLYKTTEKDVVEDI